jgi:hypothetical protein
MSYRFADSLRAGSVSHSQAVSRPVWHIPVAVCTVKISWWWTEKLSETRRITFQEYIWEISASSWFYGHVYVLPPVYFVWPWSPYRTRNAQVRDVTPGPLTVTDTCIMYHLTNFDASRNVTLYMRYVSTFVEGVVLLCVSVIFFNVLHV